MTAVYICCKNAGSYLITYRGKVPYTITSFDVLCRQHCQRVLDYLGRMHVNNADDDKLCNFPRLIEALSQN